MTTINQICIVNLNDFQNEALSQMACAKNILIISDYLIRFRRDQRPDSVLERMKICGTSMPYVKPNFFFKFTKPWKSSWASQRNKTKGPFSLNEQQNSWIVSGISSPPQFRLRIFMEEKGFRHQPHWKEKMWTACLC